MMKSNSIQKKFDSIKYFEICISFLEQALSQTSQPKAVESIKLQKDFYTRQRELILCKKAHYEKCKKFIAEAEPQTQSLDFQLDEHLDNSITLQLDIFKNIENTDSLLEELTKQIPETTELKGLNANLNILLNKLLKHLDETTQENLELKDKIKTMEGDGKPESKNSDQFGLMEEMKELSPSPEAQEEFAPLELPEFSIQ